MFKRIFKLKIDIFRANLLNTISLHIGAYIKAFKPSFEYGVVIIDM